MKKIININLSGRVIPIEDAAYEHLQRYIESLRRYFAHEEGRDEIINDIESRIAELMSEKVRRGAAAVTEEDIEEIITSMGRVEDFEQADAADNATTGAAYDQTSGTYTGSQKKRFRGRMYRDSSDKILGGVCAGIANYMNVDPSIVRLLFAIITFGGFGFGIFLYILAWIILPARDLETYVGKRLFRNPDDRIIGGVCGGLGAYFNKEAWIFRLVFAAPLLINILISVINSVFNTFRGPDLPNIFVGSFTGTFILAYIILWIVLPEARSPFQKMEMRGEKVDVNSIRQNVQEGIGDVRTRMEAWGQEVKTSAQNLGAQASEFANTRGRAFATEAAQAARPVASGLGRAIGILFKAFFLLIVGSVAFSLFIAVLVFIFSGIARPFNDFLLNGFWQQASLWGVLIFFLAIPLIAVLVWIIRRVIGVRSQNRYLGWAFAGLWLLGWICLGIFVSSMVRDFRYYTKTPQQVQVAQPASERLLIRVDEPEVQYSGTFSWMNSDSRGWDITEDSVKLSNIKLRFDKSSDSFYHVTVWRYSAGRNRNEASQRAQQIAYTVSSMDSALVLGSGYAVGRDQKFRDQKVLVEVRVPVGKKVRFDRSVEDKLHPVNVRIRENRRWSNRDWDIDWDEDWYFDWKSGVDYVMSPNGELVDVNKPVMNTTEDGVYEYHGGTDNASDSINNRRRDSLNRQLQEQRRKAEEENRKLQELEQKVNEGTGAVKKNDNATAQLELPVLSIII
ncbi:MAG: PspC domain-containing protein [Bacteroidota bacterium]|nr:PspC domain-containing protein [Bacteroidota bacterium]